MTAPASKRRTRARRAGFGSTRQLDSGRWQVRYLDSDGTRRSAPRTFTTRREAEDWLATSRADLLRGTLHSPRLGAVPLATYAAEHLAARVDLSPRTRAGYESHLRLWLCSPLPHPATGKPINLGALHLRSLSAAVVSYWYAAALFKAQTNAAARAAAHDRNRRARALHAARVWARENGHPVKATGRLSPDVLAAWKASGAPGPAALDLPDTEPARDAGKVQVAQAYRLLRSILNAALRDGLIAANPCVIKGAGQTKARERVPATAAEVDAITERMPERFAAAVQVAAYSGLRAGELFALKRSDVNLTAGTVRVARALVQVHGQPIRFGPPKSAASLRTVHLPAPVVEALAAHMAAHTRPGPDALVFPDKDGKPLDSRRRTTLFRAACAHVGRHDLRWHDLRHTGATMAAQAGASLRELQARLGHSTVAAAMIYQHATTERDREIAERMAERMGWAAPDPDAPQATGTTGRPSLRVIR
jgi:integrase